MFFPTSHFRHIDPGWDVLGRVPDPIPAFRSRSPLRIYRAVTVQSHVMSSIHQVTNTRVRNGCQTLQTPKPPSKLTNPSSTILYSYRLVRVVKRAPQPSLTTHPHDLTLNVRRRIPQLESLRLRRRHHDPDLPHPLRRQPVQTRPLRTLLSRPHPQRESPAGRELGRGSENVGRLDWFVGSGLVSLGVSL